MSESTPPDDLQTDPPRAWIEILFASKQALSGGVVRRDKEVFLKHCPLDVLQDAVYDKCFHLIETEDQFIIICNSAPLQIHC